MIRRSIHCIACVAALTLAACRDDLAPTAVARVNEMPKRPSATLEIAPDAIYPILHGTVRIYNVRIVSVSSGSTELNAAVATVPNGATVRITGNWEIGPITNVDVCPACSYAVYFGFSSRRVGLVIKTSPTLDPNPGESGEFDWTTQTPDVDGQFPLTVAYAISDTFYDGAPVSRPFANGGVPPKIRVSGVIIVDGPLATPVISGTLGTNGWYTSDATVSWTVTDQVTHPLQAKSGCDPVTISSDVDGQALTCSLTSTAGTGTWTVNVKRDATKPSLNPVVPATVDLNAVVSASPNASDALSGLASSSCDPVVTSAAGDFSVQCSATDNAGNTETKTVPYTVRSPFNFGGFQSPIDATKTNAINAGKAVPVKFSLGADKGLAILAAGSPSSRLVTCAASAPVTTVVETVGASAGSGGLSYDATTGVYTYVWKTEKSWAGTCRVFVLKLTDGVERTVTFQFTK